MRALVIYLTGINLLTFLIFGVDKWKARKGKWRIPEDTLLWLSIVGGSVGALLGMYLLHGRFHGHEDHRVHVEGPRRAAAGSGIIPHGRSVREGAPGLFS